MVNDDFIIYAVLLGSVFIFGGAAVLALAWAVRDGQFQNFERSARSIFDPAEPVGEATDYFPDEQARLLTDRIFTSGERGGISPLMNDQGAYAAPIAKTSGSN